MSKQTFHLPTWRRKPTADEAAPDIADSELVPSESAARPTRRKHGKRTYVIGGALLALAIAAAIIIPGAAGVGDDDGAGGASTTLTRPDGDPSGQTAEDNIYITTGVMDQETYRSETTGQTKAKVGFIDYNQAVHNVRVVTSDSVFTEAISTSMFVKLGEQKYFKDGAILVRKADSISGDTATWSDQIVAISQQDYEDAYGQDPRNLSNYVISRDTVLNPTMTANDDGTYTLAFDLEPSGASAYYRHQVRTYSGASKSPEFSAVHMVWTIDANWDLLQMDTVESYAVSMSGLGSLNCTSTLTEVFSDFGAVTDDQTEFQHYLETEYDPNNLGKLSDGGQDTQAIVRDFFRRTPNYSLTVTANGQSYGLTAHVDIDQTTFQVRGNVAGVDLFAAYSNERVYVAFGSQKIVLRASDTIDAARTVAGYLGVQIPNISLDAAGMTALTKKRRHAADRHRHDHPAQRPDDLRHRPAHRPGRPAPDARGRGAQLRRRAHARHRHAVLRRLPGAVAQRLHRSDRRAEPREPPHGRGDRQNRDLQRRAQRPAEPLGHGHRDPHLRRL